MGIISCACSKKTDDRDSSWNFDSKGLILSDAESKDLEVSYSAEEFHDMRSGGRRELCTLH